ncbi:MAG: lysophospholipid acyltransferase family protein [Candidatus Paceibacterota bacterium]|jgi:1-acyl-sn-glycerol-3-phosphate acyltransferase|nr:lysophospholipid acyltransferase family protein [Candidatus Paceibacterota bacterium]MDD4830941.1 lysophospholipid acyltransferase family protein [Candidatus Paceibacterota bacterium]MDD4874881.1 lysophospholipid acyltransferase family protein [Candidatus Paceibacterota bacterium]
MNKTGATICKILLKPAIEKTFINKIRGEKNIPKGNFILAANHQSNLDHIIIGSFLVPRKFKFMGQTDGHKGVKKILVNLFYGFFGVIPLDRGSSKSKKTAIQKAVEAIKKGYVLGIYPEGTRTRTGTLGEAKPGVAKIFLASGAPIVPIAIKGAFELFPPHGKLKIKRSIEVRIGKPIYFKKELKAGQGIPYRSEKYQNLCKKISEKVMSKISELSKK